MGYNISVSYSVGLSKKYKRTSGDKGGVIIGNDVWIGNSATILSGVTIGDGAVIGCNAVVTKDVPPYAIVCGNPAKVVKMRFDKDIVEALLEIRWWDFSEQTIKSLLPYMLNDDIELFIERVKNEGENNNCNGEL